MQRRKSTASSPLHNNNRSQMRPALAKRPQQQQTASRPAAASKKMKPVNHRPAVTKTATQKPKTKPAKQQTTEHKKAKSTEVKMETTKMQEMLKLAFGIEIERKHLRLIKKTNTEIYQALVRCLNKVMCTYSERTPLRKIYLRRAQKKRVSHGGFYDDIPGGYTWIYNNQSDDNVDRNEILQLCLYPKRDALKLKELISSLGDEEHKNRILVLHKPEKQLHALIEDRTIETMKPTPNATTQQCVLHCHDKKETHWLSTKSAKDALGPVVVVKTRTTATSEEDAAKEVDSLNTIRADIIELLDLFKSQHITNNLAVDQQQQQQPKKNKKKKTEIVEVDSQAEEGDDTGDDEDEEGGEEEEFYDDDGEEDEEDYYEDEDEEEEEDFDDEAEEEEEDVDTFGDDEEESESGDQYTAVMSKHTPKPKTAKPKTSVVSAAPTKKRKAVVDDEDDDDEKQQPKKQRKSAVVSKEPVVPARQQDSNSKSRVLVLDGVAASASALAATAGTAFAATARGVNPLSSSTSTTTTQNFVLNPNDKKQSDAIRQILQSVNLQNGQITQSERFLENMEWIKNKYS